MSGPGSLDEYPVPRVQFPGDDTPALFNRTGKHQGAGHSMSVVVRGSSAAPYRATLGCTCGAVIVIIGDPTAAEIAKLKDFGPVRRNGPWTPAR